MLKKAAKPENAQPAARRKLTRAERKQIEAIIRQAKGDGKPHTVQDSIPFRNLYPDGLCRLDDRLFSKTIAYEDVNYRLAGPDDQRDIFERLCDFYNGYDPSIGVQMTLSSRHEDKNGNLFGMDAQGDALDDMRVEASGILQIQYERGNNGFVKRKYVTLTIEAENLPAARARFSRIEADTLNRFKVMGAGARVLDGKERLALLHGLLHPEGGQFAFEWDWLPASGLSVKDFIAPSSFEFGETRRFRMGEMYGAVSFLQILAPEIQDRILTDFMDVEGNLLVTMHIRGINQNEAIKMFPTPLASDKNTCRDAANLDVYLSDNGIFRKVNKSGAIWSLSLSAAVFYLTPAASEGYRSTLKPAAFRNSAPSANLSSQVIRQEQPLSETAALNPDWVEWLMGFPRKWTDVSSGPPNQRESPVSPKTPRTAPYG